jgi:beta-galactosidase
LIYPEFGVDYYPEQWPESQWEKDLKLMADSGITLIRLMEFAWALIEPTPGNYDFSLFDRIIALAQTYEIRVILGTPTATVPAWLYKQDPSIFQIHPVIGKRTFGTRRQACMNSATYRRAARAITQACATHFAHDPSVIGWQLDNELGHEGSDLCVCDHCSKAWHLWLAQRYGTPQAMNTAWGTVFWSTQYQDFTQVPQPTPQVMSIQNPGLILDYYRFLSDSALNFVIEHRDILRNQGNPQWEITTDTFIPPNGHILDLYQIFGELDEVGINNYPVWGNQDAPIPAEMHTLAIQLFRGLKQRDHYTVFEQICGFQGHRVLGFLPSPNQIVHWTNHVIAHGAKRIFYFRWRTARTGQEQLCHGLVDPGVDTTLHFDALKTAWNTNKEIYSKILQSQTKAQTLVLWSKDESRLLKDQWLSEGFRYDAGFIDAGYDVELATAAAPATVFNTGMDIREVRAVYQWPLDLTTYKVIILPMKQLSDPELEAPLLSWVDQGGTLVLGYRAGTRTPDNHATQGPLPGPWSKAVGVTVRSFESLNHTTRPLKLQVGFLGNIIGLLGKLIPALRPQAQVWAEYLEPLESADFAGDAETARAIETTRDAETSPGAETNQDTETARVALSTQGHMTGKSKVQVLARYGSGSFQGFPFWNQGKPAVTLHPWGKGRVVYLGTRLSPLAMVVVFRSLFKTIGVKTRFAGQGVEIVPKRHVNGDFLLLLNHTGKKKRTAYGPLQPFEMRIVKENSNVRHP